MNFITPLIRPYVTAFTNPLFAIFTVLSLLQVWRGIPLVQTLWRHWASIRAEPLTPRKKQLAEQSAFFVAVPIGVFLHELGHALVVWLYGGRVLEFGFFFFWGYVLPDQSFSVGQEWVLASAGTWGNLIYALLIWLALGQSASRVVRYFGKRAVRFQIFFALIYYPIFTLIAGIGDWTTIYNFENTPLLSGVTAVAHVALFGFHWWVERTGRYEAVTFSSAEEARTFDTLQAQVDTNPQDLSLQARLINALQQGGAGQRARRRLRAALKRNPNWAEGYLLSALGQLSNKNNIPRRAVKNVEKALSLGLAEQEQRALAHQILGSYYTQVERLPTALQHLDQAIDNYAAEGGRRLAHAHYLRAVAQRQARDYEAAGRDIRRALALAAQTPENPLVARYEQEKELIERSHPQQF